MVQVNGVAEGSPKRMLLFCHAAVSASGAARSDSLRKIFNSLRLRHGILGTTQESPKVCRFYDGAALSGIPGAVLELSGDTSASLMANFRRPWRLRSVTFSCAKALSGSLRLLLILAMYVLQPLSVELGPGLLTKIYDGIQRPLKSIALSTGDCFIPRGVEYQSLDRKTSWQFDPKKIKVGCFHHWGWPVA